MGLPILQQSVHRNGGGAPLMTTDCSCEEPCSNIDDDSSFRPMCWDRPTVCAEDNGEHLYFALLGLLDVKEQDRGSEVYRVRCPYCDHDTGYWHGLNPDHVARRACCHIAYKCKEAPEDAPP